MTNLSYFKISERWNIVVLLYDSARSDSRCSRLKGAEKNNRLNYPCTVSKMKMNVFKAKPLNMCPIFHQLL